MNLSKITWKKSSIVLTYVLHRILDWFKVEFAISGEAQLDPHLWRPWRSYFVEVRKRNSTCLGNSMCPDLFDTFSHAIIQFIRWLVAWIFRCLRVTASTNIMAALTEELMRDYYASNLVRPWHKLVLISILHISSNQWRCKAFFSGFPR